MYRHSEDMTVVSHLLTRSQVADVGNNCWRCQQLVALPTVGCTWWHCQQLVALPTVGGRSCDLEKYI